MKIYKSLLRNKLRRSLAAIQPSQRKKKNGRIIERLIRSREFKKAANVAVYISSGLEVGTRGLILKALALGKKVCVPCVDMQRKEMSMYRISHPSRGLRKGHCGILEPRPNSSRKAAPAKLDLVIVPGLGFDLKGGRLGRGGGHFDRFLAKAKKAKKIGLAFQEQILKKIPMERNDIRLDLVITD